MNYKGIFFDYDFTLGDSSAPILVGFQKSFAAMGLPQPTMEQVRPTIGMTLADALIFITGDRDPAKGEEFYRQFQLAVEDLADEEGKRLMVEGSRLFPGAAELLAALKADGRKTAIVSTKHSHTIRKILAFQNVPAMPDAVVGGSDVKEPKPHPEGLRKAMEELGLRPEEVLFCGDTVIDARAAQNAGVDFCPVLNGTTDAEAFAPYPHVFLANDLPALGRWLGLEADLFK